MDSTTSLNGKNTNKIWKLLFILIWCMQMLTAIYFCCQKQGFHEDEYYTYYSTSRTYGLNIEDNAWMEHDAYFDEFVVLKGEGFNYGLVKQVQSWDVHPPVYYWIFHTISSLFPGKFSKWYGLILNLASFGVSMFLLYALSLKLTRNNAKLSLLVCLFYGFTPAVMSSVVFIRMYALLTVFVLLCALLHVRAVEDYDRISRQIAVEDYDRISKQTAVELLNKPLVKLSVKKFLLPIAMVTYLGFLTHYYYFIFLFFMAVAFCVYLLWKDRKLWNCIRYALSLAIAFALAYLTYPVCLGQMFRGQRGAQAAGNFFDLSNTFMRLEFFYQLLDEYVFGKTLSVWLILIILLLLYLYYENAKKKIGALNMVNQSDNHLFCIVLFAVVGYFFAVSKTALLLGDTSVRYQTPVYGMAALLVFAAIYGLGKACYHYLTTGKLRSAKFDAVKLYNILILITSVIVIAVNLSGLISGKVVFLYPEAKERVAFAKEMSSRMAPAVCIYDEGQSWCVWEEADEFFEYDRIYFASQGSSEAISDSAIADCDELVLYLSNTADTQEQLERIMSGNPKLSGYEMRYSGKYCGVYWVY